MSISGLGSYESNKENQFGIDDAESVEGYDTVSQGRFIIKVDRTGGSGMKMQQKNKFSASRGEISHLINTEITEEIEEYFCKAEKRHKLNTSNQELKKVALRVLGGERLIYIKANLMSNHHLLYDVANYAGKKCAILFLNPDLQDVMKTVVPKNIPLINLKQLDTVGVLDILFVESCEIFEDLPQIELKYLKTQLQKMECSKVLIAGLSSFRSFGVLREEIGFPFSGIALPGLKIENLKVSSSREENKLIGIRNILKSAAPYLKPDDLVLIKTSNQTEANQIYSSISTCAELSKQLNFANFHFSPINKPHLDNCFSLILYCSLPRKMEQLYSHITVYFNTYFYRNYGKLTKVPRLLYHIQLVDTDYIISRMKIYMNKVSRLQVNRLIKYIDDEYTNVICSDDVRCYSSKKLTMTCDLKLAQLIKILYLCQQDKLFIVTQRDPHQYNMKLTDPKSPQPEDLKRIIDASTVKGSSYEVDTNTVSNKLSVDPADVLKTIKRYHHEKQIVLDVEDQLIELKFMGSISTRLQEISDKVYKILLNEFNTDADLQKYLYVALKMGSSSTSNCFGTSQNNQNLQALLRHYSLAEHSQIKELFPQTALKETYESLRGTPEEEKEILSFFNYLLAKNKTFLKKEIELLSGPGKQVAAEYICYAMVKTLYGCPPPKYPLRDLNLKKFRANLSKIDYEALLDIAQKSLESYSE